MVENGRKVLSSVVATQIALHRPYGGVVPEIASRSHVEKIGGVIREAVAEAFGGNGDAECDPSWWNNIDAIAVTFGPGLASSLMVGLSAAKGLALSLGKPLIGRLFRPLIRFCPMTEPVEVDGVLMTLLPVEHGGAPCYGYLMEADGVRVGYISDCSRIPESTLALLGDLDVMVLDALRYRPHPSHMCVAESVACLEKIGAKRSYLIHLCHDLDHGKLSGELPENMFVTYDGLRVTVDREGESAGEEQ